MRTYYIPAIILIFTVMLIVLMLGSLPQFVHFSNGLSCFFGEDENKRRPNANLLKHLALSGCRTGNRGRLGPLRNYDHHRRRGENADGPGHGETTFRFGSCRFLDFIPSGCFLGGRVFRAAFTGSAHCRKHTGIMFPLRIYYNTWLHF